MARVLYLCYDGLLEPIGRSQVYRYLRILARRHQICLITFEKPEDWARTTERERLARETREIGLHWVPLKYHRQPTVPATAYDLAAGTTVGTWLVLRHRIDILHARGYVPSVMALVLRRLRPTRYIFDMRGFWADQKRDCGGWSQGSAVYRLAKWFERRFFVRADAIVSLTQAAIDVIREFDYMAERRARLEVITTCADLELFRPAAARPDGPFVLGCVGTVSISYLFDDMLECFRLLRDRRPDSRLLVLNHGEHDWIRQRARARGIPEEALDLRAVPHTEVPAQMARMHAGLFLLKAFPSMVAVSPTKLGEFLGCGVPCLTNAGIGDFERILETTRAGIVLKGLEPRDKSEGVDRLLELAADPEVPRRCREAAERYFSLEKGVASYDELYRSLEPSGRRATT